MYFIFDLDDTLLNNNRVVTEYSNNVLKELRKKGHYIVINTARTHLSLETLIPNLEYDYAICDGGSTIYNDNKLIYSNLISNEMIKDIVNTINNDKKASRLSIQSLDYLYTDDLEYSKNNKWNKYIKSYDDYNLEATKLVLSSDDLDYMNNLANKYDLILTRYFNGKWYRLSKSTKAIGNIKLKEVVNDSNYFSMAFGDDSGDIEMLLEADHGVCMKNSVESVLEVIKNVTEFDNDNDGCVKYILAYLDKKM